MLTQNRDVAVIDPPVQPKLAPLANPIYFFVRVFLYLALAFVVLPLALWPFSLEGAVWAELFGAIFALSMLLSALISAFVGWSVSRRLKRFRQGDFLAHWTYTRDEWLAFAEGEWEHRRREARKGPRLGLLIGALSGLFCGGAAAFALFPTVLAVVLGAVGGAVVLGLLGGLCGWLGACALRLAGWLTYRRMQQRVGETYIGEDAAYYDGCYWSWTAAGFELVRMELVPGRPSVLAFTLRVYMGQGGHALYTYRAAVPEGREPEARQILHRLCARFGLVMKTSPGSVSR